MPKKKRKRMLLRKECANKLHKYNLYEEKVIMLNKYKCSRTETFLECDAIQSGRWVPIYHST
jgi:hypothetical protein